MADNVRREKAAALTVAGLGLLVFCVYLSTLVPTVPGGDSGELIAAAYRLGVAHPPGYPLYTLLAKAMTFLPVSSIAWRVNLLSALCGTATTVVMAWLLWRLARNLGASVLGAGLFAFAPLSWTYAVSAEVFALNNLLVAALLLATQRWLESAKLRDAVLGAGLIGLGLSNHHTFVFLALPVVAVCLCRRPRALVEPRRLMLLCAALLLGLSPYAYLPLAAWSEPALAWGDTGTFLGFVEHFFRTNYGTWRLSQGEPSSAGSFFALGAAYGESLAKNTLLLGIPVVVAGMVLAWRGTKLPSFGRSMGTITVSFWAFYLLVFHSLANLDVGKPLYLEVTARFWQQAHLVFCLWFGLAFAVLSQRFSNRFARTNRFVAAQAGVVAMVVLTQMALHWPTRRQHANHQMESFGRALIEPLPPNALLLTRGDLAANVLWYLQLCEQVRADVTVLDQELLTKPWYVRQEARKHPDIGFPATRYHPGAPDGFSMADLVTRNLRRRPIYVFPRLKPGDQSLSNTFRGEPEGLALRLLPWNEAGRNERTSDDRATLALLQRDLHPLRVFAAGSWERVILILYVEALQREGEFFLRRATARGDHRPSLERAREFLKKAVENNPRPSWRLHKNLGLACHRLASFDNKYAVEAAEHWQHYLHLAPDTEPDRRSIQNWVDALGDRMHRRLDR